MKIRLNDLLKDIEKNNDIYSSHRDNNIYRMIRKDIINIYSLQKNEYSYYYAMARNRVNPIITN